jgi:hypothetical protein
MIELTEEEVDTISIALSKASFSNYDDNELDDMIRDAFRILALKVFASKFDSVK